MFTRLSTVFVVLLGLMALVSTGVPVPDKRDTSTRVVRANYVALAREESPEPNPGTPVVVGRELEESLEPDPCTSGKVAVLLLGNYYAESDLSLET
ncbi:hypothetical protein DFJ58DRAFT_723085 [Suillus subalutaceus]|uniref:uncharacterized protein n=1 Tax=Suillus subalutaceus TaxID=48586 RepID=UPI001B871C93|nr:uncharacterized protein DFJ58DRAFT_723085 [Suillus subalutaceus]KAG1870189.1 hypothetical protein DFJ58DRAFT_723085 [Suillus subalutaceus]